MDFNNVKLNWDEILTPYIRFLEDRLPGEGVRERFTGIIQDLNSNRIKSRAIISSARAIAYAFFINPRFNSDRLYSNIGFLSQDHFTMERFSNLLAWLSEEAGKQHRFLAVDAPFNVPEEMAQKAFVSMGMSRVERISMSMPVANLTGDQPELPQDFEIRPIRSLNEIQYSDVEYESYQDSAEHVLFSSSIEDRHSFTSAVFNEEMFGSIIEDASFVLRNGDRVAGAVLYTDLASSGARNNALLASIFVTRKYRGSGLGEFLLRKSLIQLRNIGYGTVVLYTNQANSSAIALYRKFGFVERDLPHEVFYHNIDSGNRTS